MSRYRTIVADPPWHYDDFASIWPTGDKRADRKLPYGSMSLDEIKALPVGELADPTGAALFLWTTNRHLPNAWEVLESWGFSYRQVLVWQKANPAPWTGTVAPIAIELLLVAVRGSGPGWKAKAPSCVLTTRRLGHSEKPEAFLDLIERVSPGPYVELFARRARFGWDYWGDQSLGTADLGEAA